MLSREEIKNAKELDEEMLKDVNDTLNESGNVVKVYAEITTGEVWAHEYASTNEYHEYHSEDIIKIMEIDKRYFNYDEERWDDNEVEDEEYSDWNVDGEYYNKLNEMLYEIKREEEKERYIEFITRLQND